MEAVSTSELGYCEISFRDVNHLFLPWGGNWLPIMEACTFVIVCNENALLITSFLAKSWYSSVPHPIFNKISLHWSTFNSQFHHSWKHCESACVKQSTDIHYSAIIQSCYSDSAWWETSDWCKLFIHALKHSLVQIYKQKKSNLLSWRKSKWKKFLPHYGI